MWKKESKHIFDDCWKNKNLDAQLHNFYNNLILVQLNMDFKRL